MWCDVSLACKKCPVACPANDNDLHLTHILAASGHVVRVASPAPAGVSQSVRVDARVCLCLSLLRDALRPQRSTRTPHVCCHCSPWPVVCRAAMRAVDLGFHRVRRRGRRCDQRQDARPSQRQRYGEPRATGYHHALAADPAGNAAVGQRDRVAAVGRAIAFQHRRCDASRHRRQRVVLRHPAAVVFRAWLPDHRFSGRWLADLQRRHQSGIRHGLLRPHRSDPWCQWPAQRCGHSLGHGQPVAQAPRQGLRRLVCSERGHLGLPPHAGRRSTRR